MRTLTVLTFAALMFAFIPVTVQAQCGCAVKYRKCFKKAHATAEACNAEFNTCNKKCTDKKMCKAECQSVKKSAVKDCKDAFNEATGCPDTGKAHKKCVKKLKKKRNQCIKQAKKINCNKTCKK